LGIRATKEPHTRTKRYAREDTAGCRSRDRPDHRMHGGGVNDARICPHWPVQRSRLGVRRSGPRKSSRRALQKHGADVHRCFEKSLADRLDVSGKMEIEVEVGPAGRVTATKVLPHGQAAPAALSACVQKAATGWTVEGIESGAKVVLPFSFPTAVEPVRGQGGRRARARAWLWSPGKAKPGPKRDAPFTVKVLADEINMRVQTCR
jgi:hypothetical protein